MEDGGVSASIGRICGMTGWDSSPRNTYLFHSETVLPSIFGAIRLRRPVAAHTGGHQGSLSFPALLLHLICLSCCSGGPKLVTGLNGQGDALANQVYGLPLRDISILLLHVPLQCRLVGGGSGDVSARLKLLLVHGFDGVGMGEDAACRPGEENGEENI
jgi:hypothetical protein